MPNRPPSTLTWLRVALVLLFFGGLYEPVELYLFVPANWFFHLLVAIVALPPLMSLLLAVLARKSSKVVFGAILLIAGGNLTWAVFNLDTLVTLNQPHLVVVFLSSAVALVVLLRPDTRAYYTAPAAR